MWQVGYHCQPGLEAARGYSIDLFPQASQAPRAGPCTVLRVLIYMSLQAQYCCDPTIELLLRCQAHHYLEYRLLQAKWAPSCCSLPPCSDSPMQCSCFLEEGRLASVPASRKEVFESRLSLADKRALWRFLKGTSEALQGTGSLQVSLWGAGYRRHCRETCSGLMWLQQRWSKHC